MIYKTGFFFLLLCSISASTNSAKLNRVMQMKSNAVAFGSSTPTNRIPPSIVKTPAAKVQPTPTTTTVHQLSTPKPKYNLRTRLFNNPVPKDEEQVDILLEFYQIFPGLFLEKNSNKKTSTSTQINLTLSLLLCF